LLVAFRAHLGVQHAGPRKELGVRGARHQAGHRDARVLELVAQRRRERIDKRLGPVVNRLEATRREARDRARQQDAAPALLAHRLPHLLHQVNRARDIGVDHVQHRGKVLVQEAVAQAVAGIGQQRVHRAAPHGRQQGLQALARGQVALHRIHLRAECAKVGRGALQRLVRRDHQIKAVLGRAFGQVVANARRSARDNRQRAKRSRFHDGSPKEWGKG
jgi:hypothetical protein